MQPNKISGLIIGAAIEVHRELGPGKDEPVYEEALACELSLRGLAIQRQRPVPVVYKGEKLECGYRVDVLAADTVVVELKAVEMLNPVHRAQVLTYLKLGGWKLGLLINFNVAVLKDGIERYVLGLREGSETAETRRAQRPENVKPAEVQSCYVNCGDAEAERLAREVLVCVVAVQRELGSGLLASTYEVCFCQELRLRGVEFERRKEAQMNYKGQPLGSDTIILVVGRKIVVHPLAVNVVCPVHRAALLSQLRQNRYPLGFLINFNEARPGSGIYRVICGITPRTHPHI